jgi:hypothetical protein
MFSHLCTAPEVTQGWHGWSLPSPEELIRIKDFTLTFSLCFVILNPDHGSPESP